MEFVELFEPNSLCPECQAIKAPRSKLYLNLIFLF